MNSAKTDLYLSYFFVLFLNLKFEFFKVVTSPSPSASSHIKQPNYRVLSAL